MKDAIECGILERREITHVALDRRQRRSVPARDPVVLRQLCGGRVQYRDLCTRGAQYRRLLSATGSKAQDALASDIGQPALGERGRCQVDGPVAVARRRNDFRADRTRPLTLRAPPGSSVAKTQRRRRYRRSRSGSVPPSHLRPVTPRPPPPAQMSMRPARPR